MNHLRELIEIIPVNLLIPATVSDQAAAQCISEFRSLAEHAMCFYGESAATDGMILVRELWRLPYETCWFEFKLERPDEVMFMGALVAATKDETRVYLFTRKKGQWMFRLYVTMPEFDAKTLAVYPPDEYTQNFAREGITEIRAFLQALNCSNVVRKSNEPDQPLQKARERRGKKPLFSYWTLHLRARTEGTALGGTHASPRLHLRRGHPRQYRPGVWTWVQPHMVGHKELGMVHKDYVLDPA